MSEQSGLVVLDKVHGNEIRGADGAWRGTFPKAYTDAVLAAIASVDSGLSPSATPATLKRRIVEYGYSRSKGDIGRAETAFREIEALLAAQPAAAQGGEWNRLSEWIDARTVEATGPVRSLLEDLRHEFDDALAAAPQQAEQQGQAVAWFGTRMSLGGGIDHQSLKMRKEELIGLGYSESEITPLGPLGAPFVEAEAQWISVTDRLPESGVKVLAHYLNSHGLPRRVRAEYAARLTLPLGDGQEAWDGCEWNEDESELFCPAGWYETNENEETHWHITDKVIHWMPLPDAPSMKPERTP